MITILNNTYDKGTNLQFCFCLKYCSHVTPMINLDTLRCRASMIPRTESRDVAHVPVPLAPAGWRLVLSGWRGLAGSCSSRCGLWCDSDNLSRRARGVWWMVTLPFACKRPPVHMLARACALVCACVHVTRARVCTCARVRHACVRVMRATY